MKEIHSCNREDYKSMREEILYTPEEIGQKLKLSKYTVYEMIKKGEINDSKTLCGLLRAYKI